MRLRSARGGLWQGLHAQPAHPQRQRQMQTKQPAPLPNRQHGRRQHGAHHRAQCHHHGVQRHTLAQHAARVNLAHQCAVDAQHPGHAHALQSARGNQPRQRRGQRGHDAGQTKNQHAPQVDALVAQAVTQSRQRQQQHQRGDLVGVHHPQGVGRVNLKLARHLWQGQIQHRAVQHANHQSANNDRHGQFACSPLHAVRQYGGRQRRIRNTHNQQL